MRHYILHNPAAGNADSNTKIDELLQSCGENGKYVDITTITDYSEFFATLENDDTVILCGGDGTINRFINNTEGLDIPCEVLYCATGTGNDFLHDIGKSANEPPVRLNEYIKDLPVVEVNGKRYRFINNVGFGIDGYCCEVGDKLKATSSKPVNYTSIAIKGLLFHYKTTNATVTVDGQEYKYKKVWLAPTMKGRFYGGGMMPTPVQDRNDPEKKLSVMVFYGKGRLKTLMAFPSIFKGEHIKHEKMVAIHSGSEISVSFDSPAAVQIDGETILGVTSYKAMAKVPAEANETATV